VLSSSPAGTDLKLDKFSDLAGDAILRTAIRKQVGSNRNGAIENIGAGRASKWKLAGA
jgi:hypothetical protein